jgi:hypothetical protein
MGVYGTADKQVSADFTSGRIGKCFVDAQFVKARSALEMEVVRSRRTFPVVVMKSLFHDTPLQLIGIAPPPPT